MKKSIRFNLFLLFAIMMGAFVMSGILLNAFMLEKYYILKNKEIFREAFAKIDAALTDDVNVQSIIEDIDRWDGISVVIADQNMKKEYASFPLKSNSNRLPKEIVTRINGKNVKEAPIYFIVEKEDASQPKLAYIRMTDDSQYIILTKSMKGIRESVGIANQFYVIAGVIAFVFGSLFMLRFSYKVTHPIIEMSETARDISELKFGRKLTVRSKDELSVLAQSINTLSDKLETSIESLKGDIEFQRSLSRNMSHELKTPIGVIKGYAEGLLFGVADNAEMKERYLKTITTECDRMDSLVKEMLTLSRISAKNYVLCDIEDFQVSETVSEVIQIFDNQIKERDINFVADFDKSTKIHANYSLFLRAVSNLVSNAIKYCDENKYVRVNINNEEANTQICVFNTCAGIPEEEQGKIFDEFYKIDKSRSREDSGHGLGLPIVRTIANLHGGSVRVRNIKGGVEFILTIPSVM